MIGVRTFIAVNLTNSLKERLGGVIDQLRSANADVRWVKPQNLHLTLKFLGYIEIGQLEPVFGMASQAARETDIFTISFTGLGGFPNLFHPRVIWVGVDKGKEEITRLASLIEANLSRLGFKSEERGFSPHLTLGRVKSSKGLDNLIKIIPTIEDVSSSGEMDVIKIEVMGSQLTRDGAIYTTLRELPII